MMRKRFLLSALLLFALVLAPSLSLADDGFGGSAGGGFDGDYGVKYTAVTHDGDWTGFLVKAADSWSAAVYACGGDPARISADVRSKLSDPNYGGAFYMYATNYAHIMSVYEIPEFVPLYVLAGLGISSAWHGEFGDMMLWYADTPNSLLESAMVDFRRVIAGEDLGGGSSESYHMYSLNAFARATPNPSTNGTAFYCKNATFQDGSLVLGSGSTLVSAFTQSKYYYATGTMYLSRQALVLANDYINQGYDVLFCFDVGDQTVDLVYGSGLAVERVIFNNQWVNGITGSDKHAFRLSSTIYFDGAPFGIFPSSFTPSFRSINGTYFLNYTSDVFSSPFDVSVPPNGVWPEPVTPVTPDPPEVPTPTAPTVTPDPDVTEPDVTWPDIDITVNPPAVVVPTTPEGQDYTSLLTLINDNLNSIDAYIVAINSSLNSLRSDLLVGFDSVVSAIRNVYTYLRHLDDLLERHCKHIRDSIDDNFYELELYLKGLFEWLPEQLKFDSVYDDSAVVDWLRQIYYKLGGGTYAPNPVADPGGFFGWLGGLVAGFLASLLAGLPGKIQELLSDLSDLTGYFPFSAPWDLYALLALFSHDPVTPVFTLPWGLGGGHTVNVVVDCTQWDGVMSIVRSVEKIIFAGGLAKLTFDMFKPTDVTGD